KPRATTLELEPFYSNRKSTDNLTPAEFTMSLHRFFDRNREPRMQITCGAYRRDHHAKRAAENAACSRLPKSQCPLRRAVIESVNQRCCRR
ncbi:hypothetical protein ACLOJK_023806, partial [Asimina triloba]